MAERMGLCKVSEHFEIAYTDTTLNPAMDEQGKLSKYISMRSKSKLIVASSLAIAFAHCQLLFANIQKTVTFMMTLS
jgi:hypothetical protein